LRHNSVCFHARDPRKLRMSEERQDK
jgi:hypothetical protein